MNDNAAASGPVLPIRRFRRKPKRWRRLLRRHWWKAISRIVALAIAVATVATAVYAASAADAAKISAGAAKELNQASLEAYRESLESGRPYLSIEEIAFERISPELANVSILVKNVGARAATNVTSRTTFMTLIDHAPTSRGITMENTSFVDLADTARTLANDLAPSQSRVVLPLEVRLASNSTVLVVSLRYEDPGLHTVEPPQRFYYALANSTLHEATGQQRQRIEAYFARVNLDSGAGGVFHGTTP